MENNQLKFTQDAGCPHCGNKETVTIGTHTDANFYCTNCRAIFNSMTMADTDKRGLFTGRYNTQSRESLYKHGFKRTN